MWLVWIGVSSESNRNSSRWAAAGSEFDHLRRPRLHPTCRRTSQIGPPWSRSSTSHDAREVPASVWCRPSGVRPSSRRG